MGEEPDTSGVLADEVSSETIRRVNFITGSSLEDLCSATIVLAINGTVYELNIKDDRNVEINAFDKFPSGNP